MESRNHIKEGSARDIQSEATIQTASGIVSSLIMWHNIHPSPGGSVGERNKMARSQGDGFRTWTDEAMNERISKHDAEWKRLIKPYYYSLVNEQIKDYVMEDTEDSKVVIRTRQYSEVKCIGNTRFWRGTLNKEDYIVTKTVYIVTGLTIDKKTGKENYLHHKVSEDKEEANQYFLSLKEYYS